MPKVLVIEDDALLSRMYQSIFSDHEYEVTVAHDGEDGVKLAKANPPNIVLLDLMMPKVSGLEVIKQLKADPTTADIPIVVLTSLAHNQQSDAAIELGATRYLVKSENRPNQVEEAVREILAEL